MAPQEFAPETLTQFVLSIADREGHEARSRNDFRNKGLFEHVSVKAYGIAATVIRIGSPLPKVIFGLAKATHTKKCATCSMPPRSITPRFPWRIFLPQGAHSQLLWPRFLKPD